MVRHIIWCLCYILLNDEQNKNCIFFYRARNKYTIIIQIIENWPTLCNFCYFLNESTFYAKLNNFITDLRPWEFKNKLVIHVSQIIKCKKNIETEVFCLENHFRETWQFISTYINSKMCVLCVFSSFSRPFGIRLGYPLAQSYLIAPKWF